MSIERTIAFLGAGNMAGALLDGLLHSGAAEPQRLVASDVRPGRLEHLRERLGIRTTGDNVEAARSADVVVLATKPQVFDRLLPEVAAALGPDKLVVSIAAGVPIAALRAGLPGGPRIARAMPNTPALVREGATAVATDGGVTDEDRALLRALFDSVGVTVFVEEPLLDTVTGLSGSGPAYVFMIVEALADAGVKGGLDRETAMTLATQTVLGAARLLRETGEHPGRLKDMVTSPGGTAIAGLHTLEAGGLRTTLMDAVETAAARARQLGEQAIARLGGG